MVNRRLFRRKNYFGRRFFESKSRSKSHRSERQEDNGAPAGTRRIRNQYHFLGASGYLVKALDRRIMVRRVSWSKFSCARLPPASSTASYPSRLVQLERRLIGSSELTLHILSQLDWVDLDYSSLNSPEPELIEFRNRSWLNLKMLRAFMVVGFSTYRSFLKFLICILWTQSN